MTGPELRAALADLGYTRASFAEYIGAHTMTITHWCRGARPIPLRIQRLVEALLICKKSETITALGN